MIPLGEFVPAREHLEEGLTLYNPAQHRSNAFLYGGYDPGVSCLGWRTWALWFLGYPDQALKSIQKALSLAQELSHPESLANALFFAVGFHQLRHEQQLTQERAEALITLSHEQGLPVVLAWGIILQGWVLAEQRQEEEGIAQMRQGLDAWQATGAEAVRPYLLTLLAEAFGKVGQTEEGLSVLAEALAQVDKTGERMYEAELYRIKGTLTLQKEFQVQGSKFQVENPQSAFHNPQLEAEACFLKAIDIAQKQQAKSLELRAATSLVRLRQQQAAQSESRTTDHASRTRLDEAHQMLSEIYNWFTEGFDTKDLQEAKMLLDELSH